VCIRLFVWLNCTIPSVAIFRVWCLRALVSTITDFVPCERLTERVYFITKCIWFVLYCTEFLACYLLVYLYFFLCLAFQIVIASIVFSSFELNYSPHVILLLSHSDISRGQENVSISCINEVCIVRNSLFYNLLIFLCVFLCFYRFVVSFYDGRKWNK